MTFSITVNGRQMEAWEFIPQEFCKKAGFVSGSCMAQSIYKLSQDEFQQLTAVVDPDEDYLIHIDEQGFSVNHGNVETCGIQYDFR